MGVAWRPANAAETAEAVREAAARGVTLEILGAGTRRGLGRPVAADVVLDLSALSGVTDYQPEELVITVLPATPLAEVEALLAAQGQMLGFDPPDLGPLWGKQAGAGSIGGAAMTGLGGPRRVTGGAPRDHCLGVQAVNGLGVAWASGGRVVKNVTGFDLPKLMCGAFGILGPVTEMTFKTTPAPGRSLTLVLHGLDETRATAAMNRAMASAAQVSAAAHLPGDVAADSDIPAIRSGAATLLRVDGMLTSALARARTLAGELGGESTLLETEETNRAWRETSQARSFAAALERPVWRLSVPPAAGPALGARIARDLGGRYFADWAGGAVWIEVPPAPDAHAAAVRAALHSAVGDDGNAMLVRAPEEVRRAIPPTEPLSQAVSILTRRVKAQFDPHGLFNPGRLYGDL